MYFFGVTFASTEWQGTWRKPSGINCPQWSWDKASSFDVSSLWWNFISKGNYFSSFCFWIKEFYISQYRFYNFFLMFYFIFHHLYWVCSLRVLLWLLNRFNQLLFSRREKVSLNPVKSRLCVVPGPGKSSPRIGYIKLTSFNQNASGKWTWVVTSLAGCISCHKCCSRTFTCLQGLKPHWIGKRGKN